MANHPKASHWLSQLFQGLLIALLRVYRVVRSSLLGCCCRFEPSCSLYAIEAIQRYGCIRGCYLTFKRLLRCHPWHSGGIDSVP